MHEAGAVDACIITHFFLLRTSQFKTIYINKSPKVHICFEISERDASWLKITSKIR